MTLEEAVAQFERGRVVVDGFPTTRSQTGEPYEVIYSGTLSPTKEGQPDEFGLYATEALAARWWLESIRLYAANKTGTVYWRMRPSLEDFPVGDKIPGLPRVKCFRVYSRLLISDKPPDVPALA